MSVTTLPLFGDPEPSPRVGRRRTEHAGDDPVSADRLLTAIEAAAVLGIGRSKLYELVARGAIASVKVDRCRRFRQSDLDRFIKALPSTT